MTASSLAVAQAARPNFLLLAPLCAGIGVVITWYQGNTPGLVDTLLVFVGAVLAHAAVNLLNEYDDFHSGLDMMTQRTPFSGGSGALPNTPQAARGVLAAGIVTLMVVSAIGLYFTWLRGMPMLVLGAAGVLLVLAYTRWITRMPLFCLLSPGIGFGPVMALGGIVALGGQIDGTALIAALITLLLVSELLLINQIPDTEADRRVGRNHLPIALGVPFASRLVGALLAAAFTVVLIGLASGLLPGLAVLALVPAPVATWVSHTLPIAITDRQRLNRVLACNVATVLATLALLLCGISLSI